MPRAQQFPSLPAPPDLRFSSPTEYATLLRRAHDQALSGATRPNVDPEIWASWQRSLASGIDPDAHLPRHVHNVADAVELRREHVLAAVMPALSELLADESAAGRHLLVLTNAHGEIMWRVGSPAVLRQAEELEFVEGADWSEAGIGTNAISAVVMSGRSAQLFSAQHLVRTHHTWACTASPIRNPLTGEILGVLNVSGPLDTVTADSLRMVKTGVRLAEELLRGRALTAPAALPRQRLEPQVPWPRSELLLPGVSRQVTETSALEVPRLSSEPGAPGVPRQRTDLPATASDLTRPPPDDLTVTALQLLGDNPAVIFATGRRVALSLRRAEILALLDSRQRGWSAEQLAYEVHGETGAAATIRIEMHRIRALAPGLIESTPYRLAGAARGTSDVSQVLLKLRNRQPAEALDAYVGVLVSRSAASALELLRSELNAAMGAAVRASGSAELIKRWCETDMGSTDVAAVHELGRLLGETDAAYLAFRAHSERLDRELGA
ncbi:GAF domain-containing protein [Cryobacterium sp. CG_9.6]|uniref:GAF domain-containing protein n=1 Tax=Cryobacterium sp. CG_9.6 TaxID=2760710 RepID=UPI002474B5D2|nr:GAF domain-containing protein [Cryobacterium sp. CG_9.6]MDH6236314.1 hypothetical protein [Cryobacterium sp. CG_9.6]